MKDDLYLTKVEYDIMEILWSEKRSLMATEIIEASNGRIFMGSLHSRLKKLMKIGFVEVDGAKTVSRTSARLYKPKISVAEYTSKQLHRILGKSKGNLNLGILLSSLSNDFEDEDIIIQAKQWIEDNQT